MNWLTNLCSCIPPQLKQNMVDYLNSSHLNSQVIEQQKCTEQQRDYEPEPQEHCYQRAKTLSYNISKMSPDYEEKNYDSLDNQPEDENQNQKDQIRDIFWYPKSSNQDLRTLWIQIHSHKKKLLMDILSQPPTVSGYDKLYTSQDQLKLEIFCKTEQMFKGKRINSYRFSFELVGIGIQQYQKFTQKYTQNQQKYVYHLLDHGLKVQDLGQGFVLRKNLYKKLLVINPHQLNFVTKTQTIEDEDLGKYILTTSFSVKQQNKQQQPHNQVKTSKGWLNLAGLKAFPHENNLKIQGFLNLELDVSVSPNMLKQPISKQIRIFVQKLICSVTESDAI